MFGALHVALGALVLSLASTPSKPAPPAFTLKTGEVCTGLDTAECCAQMLDLAGFKAQGDHLPRLVRSSIKLACEQDEDSVSHQVCRSILTTRGFSAEQADEACAPRPIASRCDGDPHCARCTRDLEKLDYSDAEHACYAVTWKPKQKSATVSVKKVFVIGKNGKVDTQLRFSSGQ